jgi:hypothetical protein
VLASLQGQLALGLALDALQSQDDLLGGLGLLVEDGLGLTTVTALLSVVTALTLGEQRGLASLVLGDLVLCVLAALLALAVGVSGLGNVDLFAEKQKTPCQLLLFPCARDAAPQSNHRGGSEKRREREIATGLHDKIVLSEGMNSWSWELR